MIRLTALAALLLALPVSAQSPDAPTDVVTIEAIPTYSAGMGRTDGPFTLVSLDGDIVVAAGATARADSASGAWDIGIRGTEIILNGGASGPGERRGVLTDVSSSASNLSVSGQPGAFPMDGDGECPRGAARVVCHGSGNGWYEYTQNGVQPLDRTLFVERPDGSLFSVRFVRYVLGEEDVTGARPRFVTLEVAAVRIADDAPTVTDERL